MKEECLICSAPLTYLQTEEMMECAICHKKENSKTRCVNGHYVCNECHTEGVDAIFGICLKETSDNPFEIYEKMVEQPFCHMHGPEHHIIVGSALLIAYKNAGGDIDLNAALTEMRSRGKKVPGGACGFWGACGAGISAGMFVSIVTGSTPLAGRAWGMSNLMTSQALGHIGEIGGPRCCKRNSYTAIRSAVEFAAENLGVQMKMQDVHCSHNHKNNQCLRGRCPYYKKKVAFICVHNSCRSQMAEALGKQYAGDRYDFYSAGTQTKPQINQDAVRLMKKLYGIDMEQTQYSKTIDQIPEPDIVISMGCEVECPYVGKPFDDNWGLEDPTGKSDEEFVKIIRQIEEKIKMY